MGLLDAFKQYWQDASPGGVLNPEIPKDTPVLGLLADPMGSIRSTLNKANAQADAHLNKLAAASRETAKTGKWTGPAQQAYQGEIGNWMLNTFGPLSVTSAKPFVYPQEQALLTAQKNAALPVEQGGLGLRPDNTPMERAKAMGMEHGWAHGSPDPTITELKPSGFGAEGPGIYATNYLPEATTYSFEKDGSTVYPLMVRKSGTLETGAGADAYAKLVAENDAELLAKLKAAGKDSITATQPPTEQWLVDAGAPFMPQRQHFVSTNASNFRSPFAAFDPVRRHEADLLGAATPQFLGLLAGGTGAGVAGYNWLTDR